MLLTIASVLIGVGIGLSLRPRPTRFARPRIRLVAALLIGAAAQLLANRMTGRTAVLLGILALSLILTFAIANLHLTGMGVMAIGLGANLLVMLMNGGMPVSARALRAEHLDSTVELRGARHVERASDELTILGDIIPLHGQVVSYGDLIIAFATADVVTHLTRRQRRMRGQPSITTASPVQDWGTAPNPVPSSASQYSASPDTDAPRTLVSATSAPANQSK